MNPPCVSVKAPPRVFTLGGGTNIRCVYTWFCLGQWVSWMIAEDHPTLNAAWWIASLIIMRSNAAWQIASFNHHAIQRCMVNHINNHHAIQHCRVNRNKSSPDPAIISSSWQWQYTVSWWTATSHTGIKSTFALIIIIDVIFISLSGGYHHVWMEQITWQNMMRQPHTKVVNWSVIGGDLLWLGVQHLHYYSMYS